MIPGISWDSRDYKPLISHSLPVSFSYSRSREWGGDSLTLPNMYLLHICTKKKQPFGKGTPNRGCSYITSAAGGEGVRQILTIADEGGMGGLPNADFCWRGEGGGVTQKLTIADKGGLGLQFCFTNGF